MSSDNVRAEQAELYQAFIARAQNNKSSIAAFVNGLNKPLLSKWLSITVAASCSCGRFFEQHPTIVEDTEEERLELFLQTLTQGVCKCLRSSSRDEDHENVRNSKKTWLHVAAALGCQELVEALITKANLDINAATSVCQFTPLSLAVMQTKVDLVKWLCAQPNVDMNVKSKFEKHTPLIDAMLAEKFHIVEILTQAPGVDLNAKNFRHETPLIIAVRMHNARLVNQLLKVGADHSIPNADGVLPLLLSINAGHLVVREFVNAKVPLNVLNSAGESAVTLSLRNKALDIVDLLIWGGADTRVNPALPALVLAANLGQLRSVAYLLDIGEDPDQRDDQGWTALHYACMKGYSRLVELLLDRDADPDIVTNCMSTPLSLAVFHRHFNIAELLLAFGCDAHTCDLDLDTPLHIAAYYGHTDTVRSLLNKGAPACALNRVGATPLFNAVISARLEVIKTLLPYYIDTDLHADSQGFTYNEFQFKTELQYPVPRSVLWVAASQLNVSVVTLLLYAGFQATLEQWIHDRSFPEQVEAEDCSSLRELLVINATNPRPLVLMCRCVIRRALGPGRQRQVNQLNTVPRKIKNYISLRDL